MCFPMDIQSGKKPCLVKINNESVDVVDSVKYVDIILDSHLRCEKTRELYLQ